MLATAGEFLSKSAWHIINWSSTASYEIAFKIILVSERNDEKNVGGKKRSAAHRKRCALSFPLSMYHG